MNGKDLSDRINVMKEKMEKFSRETLSLALASEVAWHVIDLGFLGNDEDRMKQINERETSLIKHLRDLEGINKKYRGSVRLNRLLERLEQGKTCKTRGRNGKR